MNLTKKQIEFLKKKEKILENTRNEIIILTASKINKFKKNKEKINNLLNKYLIN